MDEENREAARKKVQAFLDEHPIVKASGALDVERVIDVVADFTEHEFSSPDGSKLALILPPGVSVDQAVKVIEAEERGAK